MTLTYLAGGIVILAVSGAPALLSRSRVGEWVSTALVLLGASMGIVAAASVLANGGNLAATTSWQIPGAALAIRVDSLAAAFLLPIFVLTACAGVYALGYWSARENESASRVRCFVGLLGAAMAAVVVAAHAIAFLVAWELMAVAAFFLIAAEDEDPEVRSAAWTYLIATHIGTCALLAMFTLMRAATGTFILGPVAASAGLSAAIVLLGITGFGLKAGLMPLHFWLPGAHANAPSHVSALLSGAMLNVGIYGLLRTLSFFAMPPLWWGVLLLVIGLGSAVTAITLAIAQDDLKRALAYSSVENIGIITAALGVALVGRATAHPLWTALGMAAAILHVWNHSLFKGLLFFGAGSVLHGTRTRRIDLLGGLLHRMPMTAATFIAGATAAAALPGTNAFVSELLLYVAFLHAAREGSAIGLGAAALALTGALAVACFVRLAGVVFLGAPRSPQAASAHEADWSMRLPMIVLAGTCLVIGLWPGGVARALARVVSSTAPSEALAPFEAPLFFGTVAAVGIWAMLMAALRRSPRVPTWDCGYASPTARMQYTGRSHAEWLTERLTPSFLGPAVAVASPRGLFPLTTVLRVHVDEPFGDRIYIPLARRWAERAMRLRWLQQGRLSMYILYIFVTLLAGIGWSVLQPFVRIQ